MFMYDKIQNINIIQSIEKSAKITEKRDTFLKDCPFFQTLWFGVFFADYGNPKPEK